MADGDITAIEELGRTLLPASGFVVGGGVPTDHKIMVWGRITCTYVSTGVDLGSKGGIAALGIKGRPDFLHLQPRQGGGGTNPGSKTGFMANLEVDKTTELIFIVDQVGTDSPATPSDADAFTIDYFAVGEDGRRAIDLG
jgi:hypothetical protein